ncbi:GrpB family protein [Brachybacterium tyrofermentans]|uniref:GrpB family protein n=1 Tax=Brachybacterium tyrofermentans TaxID=47848 RepID=A0ABW0FDK3_9MICO
MADRAHTVVELVPYDRDWPERFSVSAAEIAAVLHGARIEPVGSATLEEYLVFRDFLRAVPAAADRYESAKHSLAREHRERRSLYVDLKQDVVDGLMLEARAWRRRSRYR